MNNLELLLRTALSDTDKVFGAQWDAIRQIPVFELKEAVALSVFLLMLDGFWPSICAQPANHPLMNLTVSYYR